MKPMKSVNVKKSPFLPATESYCELLGYQKIYLDEHLTIALIALIILNAIFAKIVGNNQNFFFYTTV